MKVKYRSISKFEIEKWITISNMFARSLCPMDIVIKQFNDLSYRKRKSIRELFNEYDSIRRKKIPNGEGDSAWLDSVMVDAHIIATEYNIDPLTAVMCLKSICKDNEVIVIK
ncbi:MAG: hypothetical protein ACI4IG_08250 [Eubacterium sp.]